MTDTDARLLHPWLRINRRPAHWCFTRAGARRRDPRGLGRVQAGARAAEREPARERMSV